MLLHSALSGSTVSLHHSTQLHCTHCSACEWHSSLQHGTSAASIAGKGMQRFLAVPMPGSKSHYLQLAAIVKELASRGHHVKVQHCGVDLIACTFIKSFCLTVQAFCVPEGLCSAIVCMQLLTALHYETQLQPQGSDLACLHVGMMSL